MLVTELGSPVTACSFASNGEHFLVGTRKGHVYDIDPSGNRTAIHDSPNQMWEVKAIVVDAKFEHVYIGTQFYWWKIPMDDRDIFQQRTSNVSSLAFVSGTTLAVATGTSNEYPGDLELWDVRDVPVPLKPCFKESKGIRRIAAHLRTETVAWSTGTRKVVVWHTRAQDALTMRVNDIPHALAFHPNGEEVAAGSDRGAVVLDVAKKHTAFEVKGHTGRVTSVAYHPAGHTLATAGWDGTVRMYEASTGKFITSYKGPTGRIYCMAYDHEGLRLAAGGDAGNVVIWDAD